MDELLRELSKPSWWFTAFVAGFVVNLASAYVKPTLDKLLGKFSTAASERYAKFKAAKEAQIARLVEDPIALLNAKLDLLYVLLLVSGCGTLVCLAIVWNDTKPNWLGSISPILHRAAWMALYFGLLWDEITTVMKLEPIIKEAKRRIRAKT